MTKMEMTNVESIYEALCSLKEDECKKIMYRLNYKFRDNTNNSQKSFDYYHKNKERLLQKRKEKLQNNEKERERLKQVRAVWYEKNKELLSEKNKKYYQQKKMEKMEKMAEKTNVAEEG